MIILTVLYYGGSLVTSDVISVGNLTSFILYAAYVGIGFNGVSTFYAEMMKALGASTRLWEIIDRPPLIPLNQGLIPNQPLLGHIQFDQVTFSYPSRPDVDVLKELSLGVPADHVMAVVGGGIARGIVDTNSVSGGLSTVDLKVFRNIGLSWIVTIPASMAISAVLYAVLRVSVIGPF